MTVSSRKKREERRYADPRKRAEEHQSGFERTVFNVPEGMKVFSLKKDGVYRIDILPYIVGEGNPFADAGMLHYERTFFTHRGIGPESNSYVCLRKTFKKDCPICDHRARMGRDPDEDADLVKALAPKERQLFNVIDLSNPDDGVQLWEISFHLFGKLLDTKIKNDDEGDYGDFFKLDSGLLLKLGVEEKSFGGKDFYEVRDIEFKARKQQYDDSMLEQAGILDDLLVEMEYDALKAIFLQTSEADDDVKEEDDEPAPKPKGRTSRTSKAKPKAEEPDDDDADEPETATGLKVGDKVEHDEFGLCTVKHISSDGTSLRLEDEDGELHKAISPLDVEPVDSDDDAEDDEPEEKPKGKGKPAAKQKPKDREPEEVDDWDEDFDNLDSNEPGDADDDADEEEEEPEEKPAPKSKPKPASKPAPKGRTVGRK